eukprot:COSAG05_NODE_4473_length_1479_cov_10.030021_1_plen_42_part_10
MASYRHAGALPPNHERKQQQGLVGAAEGAGYTREYQWRGAMP